MNFLTLWLLVLALKICLLPFIPMTPDEAYYFTWGRHLQLSYFDHPPFVAYIMYVAKLFWHTPLTIRFPGVLLSHTSLLVWYFILKKLNFNNKQILFWFLLAVVSPLLGIGSFLVTPDAPYLLFWSLSLLTTIYLSENIKSTKLWLILGVFLGLGFLSKYMMLLFALSFLVWLVYKKNLKILATKNPWLCAFIAFLIFLPVVIWNFKNNFASFGFQASHGLGGRNINLKWPLEYLLGQWALLNPLLATFLILNFKKIEKKQELLAIFSLTPILFFLFTSFKGRTEPNWPIAAHPGLIALGVFALFNSQKNILKYSFVISFLFFTGVITHVISPLSYFKNMHTKILHQWEGDIKILKSYSPLFTRSYQLAAYHSYFRDGEEEVYKLKGFDRKDFYDFLDAKITSLPAYIILDSDDLLPEFFKNRFHVEVLRSLPSGLVLHKITLKE
ncbi:MAG: glycosyltransferase family 39 protein [Oligoflexia bacterium]|nr:glycosyltransferase family 39 protein [Oligoflexia bacterium]